MVLPYIKILPTRRVVGRGQLGVAYVAKIDPNNDSVLACMKPLGTATPKMLEDLAEYHVMSDSDEDEDFYYQDTRVCEAFYRELQAFSTWNAVTNNFSLKTLGVTIYINTVYLVSVIYRTNVHRFAKRALDESQRLAVFRRCVECVHHLHATGAVHTNIKPQNFLMGLPGTHPDINELISSIVAAEATFCTKRIQNIQARWNKRKNAGIDSAQTTAAYSAPEIKRALKAGRLPTFTKKSDIYSLGILLQFLISGVEPHSQLPDQYEVYCANTPPFDQPSSIPLVQHLYEYCTEDDELNRPVDCLAILEVLDKCSLGSSEVDVIRVINSRRACLQKKACFDITIKTSCG
jgi:serine/threonine protein kinase